MKVHCPIVQDKFLLSCVMGSGFQLVLLVSSYYFPC